MLSPSSSCAYKRQTLMPKETILIVDDNPADRRMMSIILESENYHVLEASSGEAGLKILKSHKDEIALVLTDMLMPGMDGMRLVQMIRKISPHQKVIITSGYLFEFAVDASEEKPDFIEKSSDALHLVRKVREVLDTKSNSHQRLRDEIRAAFKDVTGPPRITLSVARAMDDREFSKDKDPALQQKHHHHWLDVTRNEIDRFHDVWVYMDCEAMRFYLPAFMTSYLEHLGESADMGEEPPWMTTGFYNPISERIACFTTAQRKCVLRFLQMISQTKRYPMDFQMFEEYILKPWSSILSEKAPGQSI